MEWFKQSYSLFFTIGCQGLFAKNMENTMTHLGWHHIEGHGQGFLKMSIVKVGTDFFDLPALKILGRLQTDFLYDPRLRHTIHWLRSFKAMLVKNCNQTNK